VAEVYPSDGYTPAPIIPPANITAADFYRYGKPSEVEPVGETHDKKRFEPFENESEASIRILSVGQKDDEQDVVPAYTKFILENVSSNYSERYQIVETFGDFFVFFFGSRPSTHNFKGTLINAKNANWVSDFLFYYDNYLRGTKCVELNARAVLTFGGCQMEGFILNMGNATDAAVEGGVSLNFQVVATDWKYLGFSDDFGVFRDAQGYATDENFRALLEKIAGIEGAGMAEEQTSDAFGNAKNAMEGLDPSFTDLPVIGPAAP